MKCEDLKGANSILLFILVGLVYEEPEDSLSQQGDPGAIQGARKVGDQHINLLLLGSM